MHLQYFFTDVIRLVAALVSCIKCFLPLNVDVSNYAYHEATASELIIVAIA